MTEPWDLIIVGGGAAGLMAAASAAGRGLKTCLLEKNNKLGVKILMSGGTRCNITHACSAASIAEAFGSQGKFLRSALAALPPEEVVRLVEAEGVSTKVEPTGKVFPVSDRAIDVRNALVRMATKAGAHLRRNASVASIQRENGVFAVELLSPSKGQGQAPESAVPAETLCAKSVLVTTGGKSYPGCGTTGDGYAWAKHFGHSIVAPSPALTPLVCHVDWLRELRGISVEAVEASVWKQDRLLGSSTSSLLFTHFGLSGPAPMNVSRYVARIDNPRQLALRLSFVPGANRESVLEQLRIRQQQSGGENADTVFPTQVPKRLRLALLKQCEVDPQTRLAELGKRNQAAIADALTRLTIPVHGTLGYAKAEVTAGGVALDEVDSRTMESRRQQGLYFAGEILDVDGPIGGYNFQAAFSTGWLAGSRC